MHSILERIGKIGIVPVIKIDDVEKAVPLAKALAAGGIPCVEITFRTAQGEEAIRRIARETPKTLVGAGTVLTMDQVDRAIGAGAQFIVSPGINPKVVAYCLQKGIPVTPGCANPSDIEQALEFGLDVVKFFPAEQAGGLEYIKAVSAPYPGLKFIPTGGISSGNIARYIAFDKVLACGSSWMATADLINAGDFEKITSLTREAILTLLGFSVAHIGINAGGDEAVDRAAELFHSLFGFAPKEGNTSTFAGHTLELVKTSAMGAATGAAHGTHGHIAIATTSVPRAIAYLEHGGITLDHANAQKDAQGNVLAIYLKEEILGFAIHLVGRK